MLGLPVLLQFLEFAQTHIYWVDDSIQAYRPLLSPSPTAFSLSQKPGLFPMIWLFTTGGQSIGTSASVSVLPMNIQNWFPLELSGLIFLQSKRLSRVFSNTTVQKHQFFGAQLSLSILWYSAFFIVQLSHPYVTTGKTIALTRWTFVGKAMSVLFNMLSRFVIAYFPRSKHLLISWLQ